MSDAFRRRIQRKKNKKASSMHQKPNKEASPTIDKEEKERQDKVREEAELALREVSLQAIDNVRGVIEQTKDVLEKMDNSTDQADAIPVDKALDMVVAQKSEFLKHVSTFHSDVTKVLLSRTPEMVKFLSTCTPEKKIEIFNEWPPEKFARLNEQYQKILKDSGYPAGAHWLKDMPTGVPPNGH